MPPLRPLATLPTAPAPRLPVTCTPCTTWLVPSSLLTPMRTRCFPEIFFPRRGYDKANQKGAEKRLGYITFAPSLHTSLLSGKKKCNTSTYTTEAFWVHTQHKGIG
nr:ccg-4 putative polypeptide 1; Method: conceptual translation supplied by author [Neurospora crassa]